MSGRRQSPPEMSRREAEHKFLVRLPASSMRMLRALAQAHERSVTAEVRMALEAYIPAAMLEALDDPEFVAYVHAGHGDVDLGAVRERAERDAVVYRDAALNRPTAARTLVEALEASS
jgi:plasmid stability protein